MITLSVCRSYAANGIYPAEAIVEALRGDKKHLGGKLHFILPVNIGEVTERVDLELETIKQVLREQHSG
jgi:3-dehydroquinate synthetase